MRFVDSVGLPEPIKRAIEWQDQSHKTDANITCTSLIDSPLVFWLRKRYNKYVVSDYSNKLWMLYGSLVHLIIERFGGEGEHVERKVATMINGWKVEARLDYLLENHSMSDWKYGSVWSSAEGPKPEWVNQLNVGLWLLKNDTDPAARALAKDVRKLTITALYRDWVPSVADKFPSEIAVFSIPIWPDDEAKAYVEGRVALHQIAAATGTGLREEFPAMCSDSERWMSDFAVMKEGRKNALKAKIKTREEAVKLMGELGGDSIREAMPKRCSRQCLPTMPPRTRCYCEVGDAGFCPYWNPDRQEVRSVPVLKQIEEEHDCDGLRKDGGNGP